MMRDFVMVMVLQQSSNGSSTLITPPAFVAVWAVLKSAHGETRVQAVPLPPLDTQLWKFCA
jgi:hypothetical protein